MTRRFQLANEILAAPMKNFHCIIVIRARQFAP
jgi:hypothetical protein